MKNSLNKIAYGIGLVLASAAASGTTFGPVENFDVVNDTGKTAHGFEIEMHDLRQAEITSIFGDASRWPNMERYGAPSVAEYSDPSAARTGKSVRIRYEAKYNGAWSAGTPSGTLPVNPSDSCWPYGAKDYGPNYPCDHFGVSTSVPAAGVKYSWLVEATPGSSSLVYQDSGVPAPQWTVVPQPPVNNQPQPPKVNVVIAAPQPQNYEFGEARWVKVTATGTVNDVAVEDLMAENKVIQQAKTQVQVEWQLLQVDAGKPGSGQIDLAGVQLDPGAAGVVYRFEFYQYIGAHDPGTYEAKPLTSDTPAQPDPADLGPFVVAQMAGVNFDGQIPPLPAPPAAPTINASIPDAVISTPYSAQVQATPSDPADVLAYTVTGLPQGLSVDPKTGAISGQVAANLVGQSFVLNINVADQTNGTNTSISTQINVVDAQISFAPVDQVATVGAPFSYGLSATGGTGLFTFGVFGTLPDGLLFDTATGIISGVPKTAGTANLTLNAIDSAGYNATAPLSITVNAAPVVPVDVPCSGANQVITNAINVRAAIVEIGGGPQGGGQAVQLAQATTTIVPPLTAATFFKAGNLVTFSGVVSQGVCVTGSASVALGLTVDTIPSQTVAYGANLTPVPVVITGGVAPYTVAVGGLPAGLSFDGVNIVGASTHPGTFPVTVSVDDSNGQKSYQTVSFTVDQPPAVVLGAANVPAAGTVGVAYSGSVSASGGFGTLAWSGTGLPGGVSLSANGALSGIPTKAGSYALALTVTDGAGQQQTVSRAVTIAPGAGASCTVPPGAKTGLNSQGKITAVAGNVVTFKTSKGASVSVTVPACAKVEWNGAKAFKVGQRFEWKGYSTAATGNVAQGVTIN